jgi:hypothetical protein
MGLPPGSIEFNEEVLVGVDEFVEVAVSEDIDIIFLLRLSVGGGEEEGEGEGYENLLHLINI